jgi:tetratricopeptide (TPR) repeat protein
MSDTELLGLLVEEGPTHAVREKMLMLATLLQEAGDAAAMAGRLEESRECYLKALNLLLDTLAHAGAFECPEFVPKVEMLRAYLADVVLPIQTQARLMHHYESTGEFAKAENALFALLDAEPENDALVEFGEAFYQRLLSRSDAALNAAELPRAEVQEGLLELQRRRKRKGR